MIKLRNLTYPLLLAFVLACTSPQNNKSPYEGGLYNPATDLGQLFHDIQTQQVFEDGKTFVDYTPKYAIKEITAEYVNGTDDLEQFVEDNFLRFPEIETGEINTEGLTLEEHLPGHWNYLTRQPDNQAGGTLLPLPQPYIVPGGRFREIYYWDSYFTMLGLAVSDRADLVRNMVDNFAFLIDTYGHIPNGNRSYYLSRSQPPYFSSMIILLAEIDGVESVVKYRSTLEKEYQFWMRGASNLSPENTTSERTVLMPNGSILNRYWDDVPAPRPESYREDYELVVEKPEAEKEAAYRHLKAGAESGWDFSSRWFKDYATIGTIRTTDIIPVDLNCLIYHLEHTIGRLYEEERNRDMAMNYYQKAENRRVEINRLLWNEEKGYYADYNLDDMQKSEFLTAATATPLFFGIADDEKAQRIASVLEENLVLEGGLVSTLVDSGQQWDYPNGWAPLNWVAIKGLLNYGHTDLAALIADRWLTLNRDVFAKTGKMMEKYNVADLSVDAGGGEYPLQDGFGWSNGVALSIIAQFDNDGE